MEQWVKDGRGLLFERWQTLPGIVGPRGAPTAVRGVDDAVLPRVLRVFAHRRHHACVSSQLLRATMCRPAAESVEQCGDDDDDGAGLEFRFADGEFARGIDRSGFYGLVQRVPLRPAAVAAAVERAAAARSSSRSSSGNNRNAPKPHARVLVDYAWVFSNRVYDYTTNFAFIAGAGVVPQALEEAVLYCRRGAEVECMYEVAGCESRAVGPDSSAAGDEKTLPALADGACLDHLEEFLCDSEFAFRDEGTKLLASQFRVARCMMPVTGQQEQPQHEHERERCAAAASEPPMVIPGDATVSLLVRVVRYCNAMPPSHHIAIAERLKQRGNDLLTGAAPVMNDDATTGATGLPISARFDAARVWYERAMMEMSPEALRVGDAGTDADMREAGAKIKTTLASLAHNIALCDFEAGMLLPLSDPARRDLVKRSVRFASEGLKVSDGAHAKCRFRRAAANVQLGNLDEAKADLQAMAAADARSGEDASVVALLADIRGREVRSASSMREALARDFGVGATGAAEDALT